MMLGPLAFLPVVVLGFSLSFTWSHLVDRWRACGIIRPSRRVRHEYLPRVEIAASALCHSMLYVMVSLAALLYPTWPGLVDVRVVLLPLLLGTFAEDVERQVHRICVWSFFKRQEGEI